MILLNKKVAVIH